MNKNAIIVSPHSDDAIYSLGMSVTCGIFNNFTVLNVFSISNYTKDGFHYEKEREVTETRKSEEVKAITAAGGKVIFLDYSEPSLRHNYKQIDKLFNKSFNVQTDKDFSKITLEIVHYCKLYQNYEWLFPLGIGGHIDHKILFEIGLLIANTNSTISVSFYEDLPYRCTNGDTFPKEIINKRTNRKVSTHSHHGSLNKKLSLLKYYDSQISNRSMNILNEYHSIIPCEFVYSIGRRQ